MKYQWILIEVKKGLPSKILPWSLSLTQFGNTANRKKSSWQKMLLPFDIDDKHLTPALRERTRTKEKKWAGIAVETDINPNSKVKIFIRFNLIRIGFIETLQL